MYALNEGNGGAFLIAAGSVETRQTGADAMLAYVDSVGAGRASIDLANTASLITRNNTSKGAWALTNGTGAVGISSAGMVQTFGNNSSGLQAQATNAANSQAITEVEVSGTRFGSQSERLWGGVGVGGTYNWASGKYSLYGEISGNASLMNFGKSTTLNGTLGLKVKW